MPQQKWMARDFDGLTPAVDPMQSPKLFALSGSNYVFDSRGPKSDFGNRLLTPYPLGRPQHSMGFRLKLRENDRIFTMSGDAILEWNEILGAWKVIYVAEGAADAVYAWTQAYLDGKQYFCHPTTGILVYDLTTNVCQVLKGEGVPVTATAITETNGRLMAMDDKFLYWSATSDGTDWIVRLGGAGFQKISDRVSGSPVMLTSYVEGVFVWTTGGVMRSQFTGDVEVFRHRSLDTDLRPINSFCTTRVDEETVVILDERGLFQTKGATPTPFSPLFNEFLIQYLQRYNIRQGQNARIQWDELQRRLYVSLSLSFESPLYEICFVLYPAIDKWGQFNEEHHAILPIRIEAGSRADDYYGFVDASGRVRYWNQLGSREVLPTLSTLNSVYPVVQKPSHNVPADLGFVSSSSAVASPVPSAEISGVAGYYGFDGGSNQAATLTGLSASLQLGLIRFDLEQTVDQLTEITQLAIGNLIEGDTEELSQGFSLAPLQVAEDFGLEPPNFVNCQLRIISTNDGKSEYQSAVPQLTLANRGTRHYSCSTSGLWHVMELRADAVGEAFQLHSLSMTAVYAGKLA